MDLVSSGMGPETARGILVRTTAKTAFIRVANAIKLMPVDRFLGRPSSFSAWRWRVADHDMAKLHRGVRA